MYGTTRPLWRAPAVSRLVLVAFLAFSSFCLTLPSLPAWAARGGASPATAGAVTAVLLAVTVLTQPVVPVLERRWGTAWCLASGLVALGAVAPLYLVSAEPWWLMTVSAVRGYGFAVLTVVGATLTARIAPPGRLGEVIGLYGLGIALPNLVAVPAGAALVLDGRFAWVAVLAASPLLALPLLRGLGRHVAPDAAARQTSGGGMRAALRAAGPPATALLVVTMAGGSVVTFLPIERPDGVLAPVALLVFGATGTLGRWRAGVLADRVGTRTLLPASLVASVVGLLTVAAGLGIGGSAGTALVLAGAACFGIGYGATQNLTQIVAFARAGSGGTGQASAVWNVAFDGGTAVGAYGVGAVAAAAGSFPWTYAGCAVLIALLLPVTFVRAPSLVESSRVDSDRPAG